MDDDKFEIALKDVKFIMGDVFENHFTRILSSCFCRQCEKTFGNNVTEIIDYKIFLNDLNDVVLQGNAENAKVLFLGILKQGKIAFSLRMD